MASAVTGAREFATVLRSAASDIHKDAVEVIEVGAKKITKQLQREIHASNYFKGAARNVTYDMDISGGSIAADIGPETGRGRPGALMNIAYFGGSRGGGGTVRDPMLALETEGAIVEQLMAQKILDSLQ